MKKLELRSISAGNFFKKGTSETLCNEVVVIKENVKWISHHVPKHLKPLNDEQLGYYLAGLIDGDGHFSKQSQLLITFHSNDAFLAYYLKTRLGYGNVRKIKDKNAYNLIISKKEGLLRVIQLINGKIRTDSKYNQVINNILAGSKFKDLNMNFTKEYKTDLNNHWLAGFSDADASFQVKILKRPGRKLLEVRLNYQVDQKDSMVLHLIQKFFGGNIGYRKSQDTYYYGSTSFGCARNVVSYFDKYHLQSRKYINYLKWRKVYRLIEDKEHLTEEGLEEIIRIKSSMVYSIIDTPVIDTTT